MYYSGQVIQVKVTGPPCKCSNKCFDKTTSDNHVDVITTFDY